MDPRSDRHSSSACLAPVVTGGPLRSGATYCLMAFSKDEFYRRVYREVRRKPRAVRMQDWNYDGNASLGLVAEEELQVYTGQARDFDDLTHFYFQTIRAQAEHEARDWRAGLEEQALGRRQVVSAELRDRPWPLKELDGETYVRLTARIAPALPTPAASGGYREGVLLGQATWEGTHVLARFDTLMVRADLHNLA